MGPRSRISNASLACIVFVKKISRRLFPRFWSKTLRRGEGREGGAPLDPHGSRLIFRSYVNFANHPNSTRQIISVNITSLSGFDTSVVLLKPILRVLSIMSRIPSILTGNQMERFRGTGKLPEEKDRLRKRSTLTDQKLIFRSILTNRFVSLLLFSRFSLMRGIGERNRKW